MKKAAFVGPLIVDLAILIIVGLLPLTWFSGNLLIGTSGFELPFDRLRYFASTLTWWDSYHAPGFANPAFLPNLPFGAFSALTQVVGLSLQNYEMLLFCIWFAGSGISAYVLSWVLRFGRIARLSAALFYMMNLFSVVIIWDVAQGMIQIEYAFLPLIVGLFLYGVLHDRGLRYCVGLQLLWFALGLFGPGADVELTLVYWFTIFVTLLPLLTLRLVRRDVHAFLRGVEFAAISIGCFALLNTYWLIPAISQLGQYLAEYAGVSTYAFSPNFYVFQLNSVQLVDAFRLLGYWAFGTGWVAGAYYPFASAYGSPLLVGLSFVPPAVAAFAIFRLRRNPKLLILLPCYFVALLLINGGMLPFAPINDWLFTHFATFQTTRDVILTWGLVVALCTAQLFGFGVNEIRDLMDKIAGRRFRLFRPGIATVLVIVLLVVGVLVFPFWTGSVIHKPDAGYPEMDRRIQIPGYYQEFENFIDSQPGDFRIFSLPQQKAGVSLYDWANGYTGSDMLLWFSNKTVLSNNVDLSPLYTLVNENFGGRALPSESVATLLAMLDAKYIVLHGDADWRLILSYASGPAPQYYDQTPLTINQSLNVPDISYVGQIGNLSIYRNSLPVSHIYASTNLVVLPGNFSDITQLLPLGLVNLNSTVINPADGSGLGPRLEVGTLAQLLLLNGNETDFNLPADANSSLYVASPAYGTSQFSVDGRNYSISASNVNLLGSSQVWIRSADNAAPDSFSLENGSVLWMLNQSAIGERDMNFRFDGKINLAGKSLELVLNSSNVSGPAQFLLYDSTGHYIRWDRQLSGNGTQLISLPISSPNLYSDSSGAFDATNASQLSIYSGTQNLGVSYQIGFLRLTPVSPSIAAWQRMNIPLVSGALNSVRLISGPSGLVLVNSSRPASPPEVDFSEVSPDEYKVNVINASSPFYLVFSEGFDGGWKVYDGSFSGMPLLESPIITESNHFYANGFGNAWYMNKTGTYSIVLYYSPQALYEVSLAATLAALLALVLIVILMSSVLSVPKEEARLRARSESDSISV